MHKIFCLFIFLICSILMVQAQEEEYYQMTAADQAYREFRSRKTIPPYGLSKIQSLIKKAKPQHSEYGDGGILALSARDFQSLSLREKFTYVMIHPEVYSQNCAIFIPSPHEDQKIFGQLMSWMEEETWSERQLNFLRENRDSVLAIIQESASRSNHLGVNYKDAMVVTNAWSMIPFVVAYFQKNRKDKDALTVLMQLMAKGEYIPFLESVSFQKLYKDSSSYESYIMYNEANEKLIIERAEKYYQLRLKGV